MPCEITRIHARPVHPDLVTYVPYLSRSQICRRRREVFAEKHMAAKHNWEIERVGASETVATATG
jgi:hypothetical protein